MGIDLKLIPAKKSLAPNTNQWYSQTILPLTRCHDLWILITELPCEHLAAPFYTPLGSSKRNDDRTEDEDRLSDEELEEDEWPQDLRRVTDDDFDSPLCCVAAGDLASLRDHEEARASFENRAAWAYVAELPPDARIVLYWC